MADVTLKGNTVHTIGNLPKEGEMAKDFKLTQLLMTDATLAAFKGQRLILNIFPSIDTGTCAASVREFNKLASSLENAKVLCISRDLPFAQRRFCGAEGIENVEMLSDFKTGDFGKDYGLEILDGPLAGLHSRCLLVLDEEGKIIHSQQVAEIVDEPNYESALKSLE